MALFGRRREEPVEKAAEPNKLVELGNRALYRGDWFRSDEFLPNLKGQRGSQIFKEMLRNDPVVAAVLFSITSSIRAVPWEVKPASASSADIKAADFLAMAMEDMSHSWADLVSDILTMLPYGYAPLEIVYKRRSGPDADPGSRYSDGWIGWRKFQLLPQETITKFHLDEHGGVQGVQQQTFGHVIDIPVWKLLLFRTNRRSPWGESVLRSCYVPYFFKTEIEKTEAVGVERDLAGMPVIYLDPAILSSAARKAEYKDIVVNLRRDEQEGVLLPALFDTNGNRLVELQLLSSGGSRQFDTDRIVSRHNRAIAMSLLQDTILLGHEKIGTQSLASEKRDLADVALRAWLQEIEAVVNQVAVPRLLRFNGLPLENPPRILHGEVRTDSALQFSEALRNLGQAGLLPLDDPGIDTVVRQRMGLPQANGG